jgi:ABC-2 type transport system permease protein
MKSLTASPVAGVVLFVTAGIFNVFFFLLVDQEGEAGLRDIFKVMEFIFIFIIPLLTMKVFAEERSSGTFELLMTAPLGPAALISGKFLAVLGFYAGILVLTIPYYIVLELYSAPDRAAIISGYIGMLGEGALFIAIGMAMSALTRNQIIAAITTYVILFLLYFSMSFLKFLPPAVAGTVRYIGVWSHSESVQAGVINSMDIIYVVSLTVFFLVATRFALMRR